MKKFYSLLMAGAVSVSAFASEGTIRQTVTPPHSRAQHGLFSKTEKIDASKRKVQGIRKADGTTSLDGEWTFLVMDWYFEDSDIATKEIKFVATVVGNGITFTDPTGEEMDLIGVVTPAEQKITFNKEFVGMKDGDYIFQNPFIYDYDYNGPVYQSIDAYYNIEGDMLVFNGDYYGIFWSAYTSSSGLTGNRGPINGFDFILAQQPIEGTWTPMGKALFADGWVLPGFGINQMENKYEVALERNSANENLYRLVNPYKSGPAAQSNESETTGYIIFDVTDPNHVVFKFSDAGFALPQAGITSFYAYNYLSVLYFMNLDLTIPEIIDILGDSIPYTTFKDGVVSVSEIGSSGPDTRFGYANAALWGLFWTDEKTDEAANMTAQIIFPGADAVETIFGDENGEVEAVYYNLQGMKVSNPEAGQILIKRQGGNISKIIVR